MINEIKCDKICEMFKAMGHSVRMKILYFLMQKERYNVSNLFKMLNIPQSTTSQHISVLRKCGIVSMEKK